MDEQLVEQITDQVMEQLSGAKAFEWNRMVKAEKNDLVQIERNLRQMAKTAGREDPDAEDAIYAAAEKVVDAIDAINKALR